MYISLVGVVIIYLIVILLMVLICIIFFNNLYVLKDNVNIIEMIGNFLIFSVIYNILMNVNNMVSYLNLLNFFFKKISVSKMLISGFI